MHDAETQRRELAEHRRKVDFDTYDVTVDELIRRVARGRIDIAPVYQRQFRWDAVRQSRLIESFLLGIPVPPLFMATNQVSDAQIQWEVVDGLQRLLTLVSFAGNQEARDAARLTEPPLRLTELEKLQSLSRCHFTDLPEDIRTALEDRPAKVIVLNDKSDLQVRFDLFERLNTGGVALTDQEVRECVFRGPFIDLLTHLSCTSDFDTVVILPKGSLKDGTPQEFVLRFFAYLECYQQFSHSVKGFLNTFIESTVKKPMLETREREFNRTFNFLAQVFPNGIRSPKGVTTVNLFEAVAVGAALALRLNPNLNPPKNVEWLDSKELRALTVGATNSRPRVKGRVEFCRDRFLHG
ncbi:MAG TPA: DUF262 domain-containing protein [Clostridia bacterium]|nr:DUF262 domain-containing protein [Clostridia bacterium]